MKKYLPLICLLILHVLPFSGKSQSSPLTLDVVTWNIEFFGAPYASGPADKDLQEINVKRLMRYMDADIYGLLEVVDTMRLRRLVDSLGNNEYAFVVAPYCSNNTTGTGASWTSGQKQAYIYRKSVFTNVTTRGVMRNSSAAFTNWASGRFPFLLSATATINGTSRNLNFFLLHGKSGNTLDDFTRRQAASNELKDTLDTYFNNTYNYIIGDFNDALHTSIYTGSSVSSYNSIVADSTDADHYKSVTLPLGVAGQSSMINFPNVIDNHIISNEVASLYLPGSAWIRTDVTSVVSDYVTAHNTSDHYPVFSRYNLSGSVTGLPLVTAGELGIQVSPNPFSKYIYLKALKDLTHVQLSLYGTDGKVFYKNTPGLMIRGSVMQRSLPALASGIYFLQVETKQLRAIIKLVHY